MSENERHTIDGSGNSDDVLFYDANYWSLRTPVTGGSGFPEGLEVYLAAGPVTQHQKVFSSTYARPTLSLDLSKVLFTSIASANAGKSMATVGAGLTNAQAATGRIKFTMVDDSQRMDPVVAQGQKVQKVEELKFDYSNATTGEN